MEYVGVFGIMSTLKVGTIQDHANSITAMSIDSAGRVTEPAKPFLMCNCTGHGSTVTPSGYTGLVPFQNILSSRGISLNTSTYLWTVPVTGLYNISAAVRLNADYSYLYWTLDDRTGSPARLQGDKLVLAHGAGTSFTTCGGSVLHTLETGKSYCMSVAGSSSSAVAIDGGQSWMDIHLVG